VAKYLVKKFCGGGTRHATPRQFSRRCESGIMCTCITQGKASVGESTWGGRRKNFWVGAECNWIKASCDDFWATAPWGQSVR